jgi:hypothetical protein
MSSASDAARMCQGCGRTITWRKKWARCWHQITWCSDRCRRRRLRPVDAELEVAILTLLERCARGATICPSQAARLVAGGDEDDWRPLMEPVRSAARRLCARGTLDILQRGKPVAPSTARGPIRLRLRPRV